MGASRQDLNFCWEQILQLDPWFRLNFFFVARGLEDRTLAIHGLFANVDHALLIHEAELSRVRLSWLATELEAAHRSHFPIVRALHQSGALSQIPETHLSGLLEEASARAEFQRPANLTELALRCNQIGAARMAVELSLAASGTEVPSELQSWCTGTGFHYIMRVSRGSDGKSAAHVPLELLARHQVTAEDLGTPSEAAAACQEELRSWVQGGAEKQRKELEQLVEQTNIAFSGLQHLAAFTEVRCQEATERTFLEKRTRPRRWGIRNLFRVWAQCRRLRRMAKKP